MTKIIRGKFVIIRGKISFLPLLTITAANVLSLLIICNTACVLLLNLSFLLNEYSRIYYLCATVRFRI